MLFEQVFRKIWEEKPKKNEKSFHFPKKINNFPQNLPLDASDAVSKTFSNLSGKELENFGSRSGTDGIKFFPQKLSVDTWTAVLTIVENRLKKVRKFFVRSPKLTNKRVVFFWKKNSLKKTFWIRRIQF